jgi:hypothetical protein
MLYYDDFNTYGAGENTPHAIVYLNGYIYVGLQILQSKILKINESDLSSYSVLTFPNDGDHDTLMEMVYSSSKDKLYCLFGESKVFVSEVNPNTLAYSDVIDDATYNVAQGSMATDESYLYVVTQGENKIVKYDMSDWSEANNATFTNSSWHAIDYDGTNLYATNTESPAKIAKIVPATLAITEQSLGTDNNIATDDLCFTNDYVWVGFESGNKDVLKVAKSDLTSTRIEIMRGSACYGTYYDGTWVWAVYSGTPGYIVRIDPVTNIAYSYVFDGNNPNENAFHAGFLFTTTYEVPFKLYKYSLFPIHEISVDDDLDVAEDTSQYLTLDTEDISDQFLALFLYEIDVSDDITAQDIFQQYLTLYEISVDDDIGLQDETSQYLTHYEISVFDNVEVIDSSVLELDLYFISVDDDLDAEDYTDVSITTADILNVNVFDDIAITDEQASYLSLYLISVIDAIDVQDYSVLSLTNYIIDEYESILVEDSVDTTVSPYLVSVSDDLDIAENIDAQISPYLISEYESVATEDYTNAAIVSAAHNVSVFESTDVQDYVNVAFAVYPFLQAFLTIRNTHSKIKVNQTMSELEIFDTGR